MTPARTSQPAIAMPHTARHALLATAFAICVAAPSLQAQAIQGDFRTVGIAGVFHEPPPGSLAPSVFVGTQPDEVMTSRLLEVDGPFQGGSARLELKQHSNLRTEVRLTIGGSTNQNLGSQPSLGTGTPPGGPATLRSTFRTLGTPPVQGSLLVRYTGGFAGVGTASASVTVQGSQTVLPLPQLSPGPFPSIPPYSSPPPQSLVIPGVVVDGIGLQVDVAVTGAIPTSGPLDFAAANVSVEFLPDVLATAGCTLTRTTDSCVEAGIYTPRFPLPGIRAVQTGLQGGPPLGFAIGILSLQPNTVPLGQVLPPSAAGCVGLISNPLLMPFPRLNGLGDGTMTIAFPAQLSGSVHSQVVTLDSTGRWGASNIVRLSCP